MHSTVTVQALMDSDVMFPDTLAPPWDELVTELKDRYLPADHSLRVELRFGATAQRSWLEEYVERFKVPSIGCCPGPDTGRGHGRHV